MTDPEMRHAPACERPGTTTERGHTIAITKCSGCGAILTVKHGIPDPDPEITPR